MAYSLFNRLLWALVLLMFQVLVFNHIHLWGFATPLVYVYILCLQPLDQPRSLWLLWGFVMGLLADLFTAMPGVGAASMTLAALCAPSLLRLFAPKDGADGLVAGYRTLGRWKYAGYVSLLVLLQQGAAVLLEFFSFFNPLDMLLTWLGSSALTLPLLLAAERMRGK